MKKFHIVFNIVLLLAFIIAVPFLTLRGYNEYPSGWWLLSIPIEIEVVLIFIQQVKENLY